MALHCALTQRFSIVLVLFSLTSDLCSKRLYVTALQVRENQIMLEVVSFLSCTASPARLSSRRKSIFLFR